MAPRSEDHDDHEDRVANLERDDRDPWALNLVVRLEKDRPTVHEDLLVAAASATLALLYDPRALTTWQPAISRWHDGRIRKLCRRARGAKWSATDPLDHVEVTYQSATVRAFPPTAVTAQPPELARLQMTGTDLIHSGVTRTTSTTPQTLEILVSPELTMTSAKAAVQVAHAAQLAVAALDNSTRVAWLESERPIVVRLANSGEWASLDVSDPALVVVHDAGFTEIAANSRTCVARFCD